MPARPSLNTVRRDASLAPATVTEASSKPALRRRRTAASAPPAVVSAVRVHPLVWAEVRRRTAHLADYQLDIVSATEVDIR